MLSRIKSLFARARRPTPVRATAPTSAHEYRQKYQTTIPPAALERGELARADARSVFTGPLDEEAHRDFQHARRSELIGQSLDMHLLRRITERYMACMADSDCVQDLWAGKAQEIGLPESSLNGVRCMLHDPEHQIPETLELLNPELVTHLGSCLGHAARLSGVYFQRNRHVPAVIEAAHEVLSDRWHFDHCLSSRITLFVALSHIRESDGPFHSLSRADSIALFERGYDPDLRTQSRECGLTAADYSEAPSYHRLTGPPGSLLAIETPFCLHRAGVPAAGAQRDILSFTFDPSPQWDLSWESAHQPDG